MQRYAFVIAAAAMAFATNTSVSAATVSIDPSHRRQVITGVGVGLLPTTNNQDYWQNPANMGGLAALGVSLVRIEIDPNTQPSSDQASFTMQPMQRWIAAVAALRVASDRPLTVIATVQSPPGWLKTSGLASYGGRLLPGQETAYGAWIVRVLQGLREAGIEVASVCIEDDPIFADRPLSKARMPGCALIKARSFCATFNTTSFSYRPLGPIAPGSSPPWPGSITTR